VDFSAYAGSSRLDDAPGPLTAAVDVAVERARTVGAASSHHLNSAGSALPTAAVVDAVIAHLRYEERVGGYEASAARDADIEAVYAAAARVVGAAVEEIALVDSATTGLRVIIDAMRLGTSARNSWSVQLEPYAEPMTLPTCSSNRPPGPAPEASSNRGPTAKAAPLTRPGPAWKELPNGSATATTTSSASPTYRPPQAWSSRSPAIGALTREVRRALRGRRHAVGRTAPG